MSLVEALICLGCTRYIWKRCTHSGGDDTATWPLATAQDFQPIPRICRIIQAAYHSDHIKSSSPSDGPYPLNPDWVIKRATYEQTQGRVPPYMIYVDHNNKEIILAVRGLNLINDADYKVLLDNKLGMQKLDGGYVHHGLFKAAVWLLKAEAETLGRLWVATGAEYTIVFAGHSLGSGVAALAAVVAANYGERLGGVPRRKVRCYAVAPARCVSLDLAVKYADVIQSVVLQDDFLPRTPTPLEDIFKSIFCLPYVVTVLCMKDTLRLIGSRKLRDQRKLYAPGRMYHIVYKKFCRCSGRIPLEVRTETPADGMFEHIVLSCNATSDHGIYWIEREAEKALQRMNESNTLTITTAPTMQRFQRPQKLNEEYKEAIERAVDMNMPCPATPEEEPILTAEAIKETFGNRSEGSETNWDELVEKLFNRNEPRDPQCEATRFGAQHPTSGTIVGWAS